MWEINGWNVKQLWRTVATSSGQAMLWHDFFQHIKLSGKQKETEDHINQAKSKRNIHII